MAQKKAKVGDIILVSLAIEEKHANRAEYHRLINEIKDKTLFFSKRKISFYIDQMIKSEVAFWDLIFEDYKNIVELKRITHRTFKVVRIN